MNFERLIQVGQWFGGKPTGHALRSEDLGSPVPALIDLAEQTRYQRLLTGLWITDAGLTLKFLGDHRELVTLPPLAVEGLARALTRRGNEEAPNMAESPVVVWSEAPVSGGIMRVVRITLERAGSVVLRISVRFNYAVPIDFMLAEPAEKCWDALNEVVDFALAEKPRMLVVGPSGSGKTTVVQGLIRMLLERQPLLCLTYFGRFWDPVVFRKPTVLWGPGQEIVMPVAPVAAIHTQARFVGGLSTLVAAADQGATRSEPDFIIQDEMLSSEDTILAAHAATVGAGYISTAHTSVRWSQWEQRVEALSPDGTVKRLATPEVVIEVLAGKVVRIWHLSQLLFSARSLSSS